MPVKSKVVSGGGVGVLESRGAVELGSGGVGEDGNRGVVEAAGEGDVGIDVAVMPDVGVEGSGEDEDAAGWDWQAAARYRIKTSRGEYNLNLDFINVSAVILFE
jgi:hypothetical protein